MIYFPYDNKSANVQDRNVNSTQFASFIYKLCGYKSGIFETLGSKGVVKVKNGMTVTVAPLDGAIQGRLFDEVAVRELQLDTGGELDRIDTVVVRANLNDRTTDLYITKGVEASLPTRPALKHSGGIHEIGLADIYIPKLTATITDSRITDTRIDTDRMAILPVINSVDTSAIFNQYQSALDEYLALVETAIDGTTAGHLQNQIGTLADLITESKTNIVDAVNENARNVEKNRADIEENKPKLLWTNASPTTTFADQTITLDLSKYEYVEIYASTLDKLQKGTFKAKVGDVMQLYATNGNYNDTNKSGYRLATINTTGIAFTNAYYNNASGNNYFIPLEIRGIV